LVPVFEIEINLAGMPAGAAPSAAELCRSSDRGRIEAAERVDLYQRDTPQRLFL